MARRVLSVASECVPLVKTGGLADVTGALPGALAPLGWDMRVLIPAYPGLLARIGTPREVWADSDLFGGPARVVAGSGAFAAILLLDAPHLYDRTGGPYLDPTGRDYRDNPERFAALSWAAAALARTGLADGWRPEVLHAHDWQGALAPAYLRYAPADALRTVLTVHNIAFQGLAPSDRIGALRLPYAGYTAEGFEYWDQINVLKAGLVTADAITTVSPRYAEELMRPAFGMGLEGVIAGRAADLVGILNGVDTDVWSPEADPAVTAYGARTLARKRLNRRDLMSVFDLAGDGPLAIVVSRLTEQKGIDLIPEVLPDYVRAGGLLAVLGTGAPDLERAMVDAAARFPGRVGVQIGYDEALSHRMFAGGDAVLVPSRFEPCGLTQMYGLRYGTVPVVAATGGLADTVIDANPAACAARVATGITFAPTDAIGLAQALRRLVTLYADRAGWTAMQRQGMKQPVGWATSAAAYAALYAGLGG